MNATPYPEANDLLDLLLSRIKHILGDKLVGLYLYGSLVWGGFDESSDVDLLAATATDVGERELAALKEMHDDIARTYPKWHNRIEVQYLSLEGLHTFRTRSTPMAVISPGEPFHAVVAANEWLLNWYFVREKGVALYGPSPTTIIGPIPKEEFVHAAIQHVKDWREWIEKTRDSRPYQAYQILTACRTLYVDRHGEPVSKQKAASWAAKELPQWATLIQNALVWRREASPERVKGIDQAATFPETERFIRFMSEQLSEA